MPRKPSIESTDLLVQRYIDTAYDKVVAVYDNLSYITGIGEAIEDGGTLLTTADASDETPARLGTEDPGVSTDYSRMDHVHSDQLPATTVLADGAIAATQPADDDSTKIATTAFVLGQASDSSPQDSGVAAAGTSEKYSRDDHVHSDDIPATGTLADGVTATTQTNPDNSTKVATTAYVDSKVSTAITEDEENIAPSQAATFDALALKANAADAALTGTPVAPTPALDTDTTQLATTQFVLNQASDDAALALGTTSAGTDESYSRADHVHTDAIPATAVLADGVTATTQAATDNSTKVATTKFVTDRISQLNLFTYKGEITNADTDPDLPAADAGDVWIVTTIAGTIGGGPTVEIGDTLLCLTDSTASGDWATVGSNWVVGQVNLQPELFALLSGATFTGDTIVPDQTAGNNSTKAANTKYVDAADNLKANLAGAAFTGDVSINGGSFDMTGTDTHFAPPSLTSTERDALTPSEGWVIFNETDSELQQYANGAWGSIGGGDSFVVTKTSHGWTDADVGTKVYKGTGAGVYVVADSSTTAAAESFWYISKYIDADRFELKAMGLLTRTTTQWDTLLGTSGGLTEKDFYYLAENGASYPLTTTAPTTDGLIDKPVAQAQSTTEMWYFDYRGIELETTYGATQVIEYADLDASDQVEWTHGLNTDNIDITARDANGEEVSIFNTTEGVSDAANKIILDFTDVPEADFPFSVRAGGDGGDVLLNIDTTTTPEASDDATGDPGDSLYAAAQNHKHPMGQSHVGFSVHKNNGGNQAVATSTYTKITWDGANADWDTTSDFDDANDRYTPSIAGKYLLTAGYQLMGVDDGKLIYLSFYKNGVAYKGPFQMAIGAATNPRASASIIVDANGSTDYFEVHVYHTQGTNVNVDDDPAETFFQGSLLR